MPPFCKGFMSSPLNAHPFILPNLFGSLCSAIGWLAVKKYFHETLPDPLDFPWIRFYKSWRARQAGAQARYKRVNSELELGGLEMSMGGEGGDEQGGAATAIDAATGKARLSDPPLPLTLPPATISSLLHHSPTRGTLIVYWIFSFCITGENRAGGV